MEEQNTGLDYLAEKFLELLTPGFENTIVLMKEHGVTITMDELHKCHKIPAKPRVVYKPPYLGGEVPTKNKKTRGSGNRCPFILTKGKNRDKECNRPANFEFNGIFYCPSHEKAEKKKADAKGISETNSRVPAPYMNGTHDPIPKVEESSPDASIEATPIPGYDGFYYDKGHNIVLRVTEENLGIAVGKMEDDNIVPLTPDEKKIVPDIGMALPKNDLNNLEGNDGYYVESHTKFIVSQLPDKTYEIAGILEDGKLRDKLTKQEMYEAISRGFRYKKENINEPSTVPADIPEVPSAG